MAKKSSVADFRLPTVPSDPEAGARKQKIRPYDQLQAMLATTPRSNNRHRISGHAERCRRTQSSSDSKRGGKRRTIVYRNRERNELAIPVMGLIETVGAVYEGLLANCWSVGKTPLPS